MNSLSWFLYGAEVIGNVKALVGVSLGVSVVCCVGLGFLLPATGGDILKEWPRYGNWWRRSAVAIFIFALWFSVMPSQATMYAIAASEVGERFATSDAVKGLAGDARKALEGWIRRQIDPPQSEKRS